MGVHLIIAQGLDVSVEERRKSAQEGFPDEGSAHGYRSFGVAEMKPGVDTFIERGSIDAPEENQPGLRAGCGAGSVAELDLDAAGIGTIIWAADYAYDFGLVKVSIFVGSGTPSRSGA